MVMKLISQITVRMMCQVTLQIPLRIIAGGLAELIEVCIYVAPV